MASNWMHSRPVLAPRQVLAALVSILMNISIWALARSGLHRNPPARVPAPAEVRASATRRRLCLGPGMDGGRSSAFLSKGSRVSYVLCRRLEVTRIVLSRRTHPPSSLNLNTRCQVHCYGGGHGVLESVGTRHESAVWCDSLCICCVLFCVGICNTLRCQEHAEVARDVERRQCRLRE